MRFIKKYKKELFLFFLLSLAYFLLRTLFLSSMPMFTDEAIYVRWAQIALNDSSWRFISLTDGKQPMFVWFAMVFMKFIEDPLIAGRLVSVFTGFFTMIGLFFLSYELFKRKRIAFLTSTLYVFYPFAQVMDRMALMDSMVGTFSIWALYFSVLLVRKLRLDIAYTLGIVIGAGTLTKTSNFFSIYLLPFTLVLFNFKEKKLFQKLFRFIALALFSTAIGYGIYNILRLSPLFQMIEAKNAIFVYPFSEWLSHPFTFFVGNLNGLISWLLQYLKLPYVVLLLVSYVLFKKYFREKLLLTLYFLLPFVALALFGRVIFPRFIFFMSLYLLPIAAWGLNFVISEITRYSRLGQTGNFLLPYIIVLFFIWHPLLVSASLAKDPINSKIAKADNSQYINSWASGWGVSESVSFFEAQAKMEKIFIATEGTFGLMPEAMEIYLINNKNVAIKGYWPLDEFPKEVLDKASKMPTYFIFYQEQHREIPESYPLKLLFKVRQGNTNYFYRVYQVIPQ